jgi:predicted ATPase/class 3 adenylate cyclase
MASTLRTLPSGIVTFLFTDIEGSTRLWERDAAVMRRAIERHNAILAQAIAAHSGHHFKTIGDALQAAFADPVAAVAAAAAAQRSLEAEPWSETGPLRVRMALHRGQAVPLADGDYLAPSLNRLARLLAAGYGGQVLLTQSVWEAVGAALPDGVTTRSVGKHRLRDLLEAEEVWQLVIAGLPATFPPLKSLEKHPTNLPAQLAPLIGRDAEVAALADLLDDEGQHVVTLIGPGGVGKTRLALAAAAEALAAFDDGAFLVALSGIEDASLLLPEIAAVLGVREGGGLSLEESVLAYLGGKRLLLILDNLEQLEPFEAAAAMVARLLTMRVMATSRAPLHIRAEREWPVAPLPTPDPDLQLDAVSVESLDTLLANPAVALFVERARAARPIWRLTAANAADVAEIARRLDGLPLALELAAARVRVFTPAEIIRHLGEALDLHAPGREDRPDRQLTLRAAIAWSHDLLSFEQQVAFRRLSIFSGDFTLEGAEKVLAASPDPWIDVLDAVAILIEQSLVQAEEDPNGEGRYRMLETIRAFALEKLASAGEEATLRQAHAAWAEAFARHADIEFLGPDSATWLERCEREHDNFRSAIAWAIENEPDDLGLRIPEALWRFWQIRGHYTEARRWLEQSLAASPQGPSKLRGLALDGVGVMAMRQGDFASAMQALEQSLTIWRGTNERKSISGTLSNLGAIAERQGDLDRAQALQEEALTIARELGDPLRVALILNNLATALQAKGETSQAITYLEESVAIKRKEGNLVGLAASLTNLAILMVDTGDLAGAIANLKETLEIDRRLGNVSGIADTLGNLAALTSEQGDLARAAALDAEALETWRNLGDRLSIAYGLESIASTFARAGFPEQSASIFGAAERLREELAAPLPPSEHERYEKGLFVSRQALSPETFKQAWDTGRALSLDDAIAEALHIARQIAHSAIAPD